MNAEVESVNHLIPNTYNLFIPKKEVTRFLVYSNCYYFLVGIFCFQ